MTTTRQKSNKQNKKIYPNLLKKCQVKAVLSLGVAGANHVNLFNMRNNILVTALETDDESFARALGITQKREAEIDEIMDRCHGETNTYPDAIAAISEALNNANELAYASFHLGAFAESRRAKNELLYKLLGE